MEITLHEISAEMLPILSCEEWTEEQVEKIEELNMVFEKKADNITRYQDNIEAACEAIRKEEKRLAEKRRVLENRSKNLDAYLMNAMKAIGRTEIDLVTRTVKIQKNPPSVVVDDADQLPAKFVEIVQTLKVDKKALKDALKKGEIEGAHLEQGERLVVK